MPKRKIEGSRTSMWLVVAEILRVVRTVMNRPEPVARSINDPYAEKYAIFYEVLDQRLAPKTLVVSKRPLDKRTTVIYSNGVR